jgi:hypothetical protein
MRVSKNAQLDTGFETMSSVILSTIHKAFQTSVSSIFCAFSDWSLALSVQTRQGG